MTSYLPLRLPSFGRLGTRGERVRQPVEDSVEPALEPGAPTEDEKCPIEPSNPVDRRLEPYVRAAAVGVGAAQPPADKGVGPAPDLRHPQQLLRRVRGKHVRGGRSPDAPRPAHANAAAAGAAVRFAFEREHVDEP